MNMKHLEYLDSSDNTKVNKSIRHEYQESKHNLKTMAKSVFFIRDMVYSVKHLDVFISGFTG